MEILRLGSLKASRSGQRHPEVLAILGENSKAA